MNLKYAGITYILLRSVSLKHFMFMQVIPNYRKKDLQNFFVKENGDSEIQKSGILSRQELNIIQKFIKENYKDMYKKWSSISDQGFFVGK